MLAVKVSSQAMYRGALTVPFLGIGNVLEKETIINGPQSFRQIWSSYITIRLEVMECWRSSSLRRM